MGRRWVVRWITALGQPEPTSDKGDLQSFLRACYAALSLGSLRLETLETRGVLVDAALETYELGIVGVDAQGELAASTCILRAIQCEKGTRSAVQRLD